MTSRRPSGGSRSSSMNRDVRILEDAIRHARLCQEVVQGLDSESFASDIRAHYAAIHLLCLLGEAAKRLSQECRDAEPSIPWSTIGRMRDKLIHHYEVVDVALVWVTIQEELPGFITKIENHLQHIRHASEHEGQ
ncbi:DUF86 domain-containing protein [bacterium]|nr:DUF86 domain-containing protein [bacterium]